MARRRIHRLPGMRDVTGHAYQRMSQTIETLKGYLGQTGYHVVDTPLVEETELFVRKSGGEITSRLYSFTDPGGNKISLRPEFTSSVIRYFIQERDSLSVPVRWQYCGPVFRYEQQDVGGFRQFTQLGVELVGAAGAEADAEVIFLAWEGLNRLGLSEHQLRIGHLGVLRDLLGSYRLSDAATLFIIGNVQGMKSGRTSVADLRERGEDVGLLRGGLDLDVGIALAEVSQETAEEFIRGVLQESMPAPIGRRTTDEIAGRLLRKVRDADDPGTFEAAASMVSELAQVDGPPSDALAEARRIAGDHQLSTEAFEALDRLLDALASRRLAAPDVIFDLGLARGIAYYTGVIFELMHPIGGRNVSLGGGGRYDGLIQALGGDDDVPAAGYAYYMDHVVEAVGQTGSPPSQTKDES